MELRVSACLIIVIIICLYIAINELKRDIKPNAINQATKQIPGYSARIYEERLKKTKPTNPNIPQTLRGYD